MEPFPRTYRIGSGREVPVIRSCSMLQSVRVAFSVGGTPAADYWRWHAQNLCAFISQARVSASAYPHLRTFVISIKVGAAEDQRVPLPEIASSLDETLVYLVRETSLQSVAFEWVRSTKWRDTLEGDEFADYIYKTFPVLRRDNRVTIQAPIRKGL
ncbi:hypothetical protein PsYK624_005400 [Phanerochaete sordida]|uniref:Uncharacterized protein n=1 Tax=Phanerochaete sordida TaxID=48140 RepID=A0A9P3FY54_9APHY|nr:hypothetical protein PsYK624_005400 [Phanerochaete sordida]